MEAKQKRVRWLIGLSLTVYVLLTIIYFLEGGELDWQYFSVTVFGLFFLLIEVQSVIIKFKDIHRLEDRIKDKRRDRDDYIKHQLGKAFTGFTNEIQNLSSKLDEFSKTERRLYYGRQILKVTALISAIWVFFDYHNFNKGQLPVTKDQVDSNRVEIHDSLRNFEYKLDEMNKDLESLRYDLNKIDSLPKRISKIEQRIDSIEIRIVYENSN